MKRLVLIMFATLAIATSSSAQDIYYEIKHKAEAYMLISDCYVSGFGTKRNLNKAAEYYDLALAEGMEPDHEEARRIEDKIKNAVQRQNELMGLANESSRRDFDSDTFRDWLNR